jgi:hypothetical protein
MKLIDMLKDGELPEVKVGLENATMVKLGVTIVVSFTIIILVYQILKRI